MRKASFTSICLVPGLCLVLGTCKIALADGSSGPAYYSNGDAATAAKECVGGEACATITQANGDTIKVLTGESGRCNSYVVTFMRYVKDQLVAVWASSTDRNADTQGMMGGAR